MFWQKISAGLQTRLPASNLPREIPFDEAKMSRPPEENQLILWKYTGVLDQVCLKKVKELTGPTSRVLSLACSPDVTSTVVSAAGDENRISSFLEHARRRSQKSFVCATDGRVVIRVVIWDATDSLSRLLIMMKYLSYMDQRNPSTFTSYHSNLPALGGE
jgi:hypothetical protein